MQNLHVSREAASDASRRSIWPHSTQPDAGTLVDNKYMKNTDFGLVAGPFTITTNRLLVPNDFITSI